MYRLPLLALLAAGSALAADKPPAFEDVIRATPAGMTTETLVQEELKLSAEQVAAVGKALAGENEKFVAAWKALGAKPADEGVGKLAADTRRAANEAVAKVLSEGQSKRLKQLELQARGPVAFDDPEVRKALGGVTDEQVKKWEAAKDEYERKVRKHRREAGGADTVKRIPGTDLPLTGQEVLDGKTALQLKKEYWLTAKNVLTADQLNKWYELIGDVFPNPEKKK